MKQFSKVIIWGHKLNSHTHSYIHYGFHKAFKFLGYDTYWLDNTDNISHLNFDNCLFITEQQAEQGIPVSNTSKYVFHSIASPTANRPYTPDLTIDILQTSSIPVDCRKVNYFTYENTDSKLLIQPWATDLLPNEFNFNAAIQPRKLEAYFFGTVVKSGWNDNHKEINEFQASCFSKGIVFFFRGLYTGGALPSERCIELMRRGIAAPVIQSVAQINAGYIPCRIFKNISYGNYGMTNSKAVGDLLKDYVPELICNDASLMLGQMFDLKNRDTKHAILLQQMKYIQSNHTYINRIESIMERL
jgi:hypothetical protein